MNNKQQFEEWYLESWGHTEDNHESLFERCQDGCGDEYYRHGVRMAYEAWQAASKASEQQLAAVVAENDRAVKAVTVFSNVTHDITEIICDELGQERVAEIVAAYNDLGNMLATYAYLAEVRAQARKEGAHFVANRMLAAWDAGFIDDTAKNAADIARMILTSTEFMADAPEGDFDRSFADGVLEDIAAQLRQGAEQ